MSSLKNVFIKRDDLTSEEADSLIGKLRNRVLEGENPEAILMDEFDLEPDYVFDLIDF